MIEIKEEKNCCGCGACAEVCPKQCIHMEERTLGAAFPVVDTDLCIHCDACTRVCPIINVSPGGTNEQAAYAAIANDPQQHFEGSSGGAFGVLARDFLKRGGVVYGAAFDEQLKLRCTAAETEGELKPLFKSKYLQSDMTGKFREIRARLQRGEQVMFVSTPCQNAALKRYLNKDFPNLLQVDFFCHGVPSQKFFNQCIAYEDQKRNMETTYYEFRTKVSNGTTPHYFTKRSVKNGNELRKTGYYFESPFYAAFQQYVTLRESCYACEFSGRNRCTDITLGDFHDIDRYMDGINRFDGISTIIVNTTKGAEFLEAVKDEFQIYEMDINQLIADGTIFSGSTKRPAHREAFVDCYEKDGIAGLMEQYLNPKRYIKNRIYYGMPAPVRKLLKKIL